jgi:hypothetical protein
MKLDLRDRAGGGLPLRKWARASDPGQQLRHGPLASTPGGPRPGVIQVLPCRSTARKQIRVVRAHVVDLAAPRRSAANRPRADRAVMAIGHHRLPARPGQFVLDAHPAGSTTGPRARKHAATPGPTDLSLSPTFCRAFFGACAHPDPPFTGRRTTHNREVAGSNPAGAIARFAGISWFTSSVCNGFRPRRRPPDVHRFPAGPLDLFRRGHNRLPL